MSQRDQEVVELVVQKGFSQKGDALLFEYVASWLNNNQFRPGNTEDIFDSLMQSVGVQMYIQAGKIPEDED